MLFRFWVFPDCTFLDISIAASRKSPPKEAGDPVERPEDRIAEKPCDTYDHQYLCHFFLLEFISK